VVTVDWILEKMKKIDLDERPMKRIVVPVVSLMPQF
jgi:hypothetical protein